MDTYIVNTTQSMVHPFWGQFINRFLNILYFIAAKSPWEPTTDSLGRHAPRTAGPLSLCLDTALTQPSTPLGVLKGTRAFFLPCGVIVFSPVVNLDSLLFSHLTQEPDFTPCPILIHVVIVIPSILGCEMLLEVDYHPVS